MKRTLSVILAVCMIVALLPATLAQGTETTAGITIKYDIISQMLEHGLIWGSTGSLKSLNYESSNGFFNYVYGSRDAGGSEPTTKTNILQFRNTGTIEIYKTRFVTFEVYVPKAGTYKMQMVHGVGRSDQYITDVEVYKIDGKYADNFPDNKGFTRTTGTKIGTYSCVDESVTGNKFSFDLCKEPSEVGTVEISAPGYYVFTFTAAAAATTSYSGSVGTFSLISGDGSLSALMGKQITSFAEPIAVGENVTVKASAYLSATGGQASFTYASSNPSVATVNASTGVVTGVSAGKATIIASCASAAADDTIETEITVSGSAAAITLSDAELKISGKFASAKAILSNSTELSASELREKGGSVSYASSNPLIASVDEVTGEIEDIDDGTVKINATLTYKSVTLKKEISYTSKKPPAGITVNYDLIGQMLGHNLIWGSKGSLADINYDSTNGFFSYAYASSPTISGTIIRFRNTGTVEVRTGKFVAFEAYVPKAGTYKMLLNHGVGPSSQNIADIDVYMLSGKFDSKTYTKTGGTHLGTYSCVDESVTGNKFSFDLCKKPSKIENVEIPAAGYYVFTFTATSEDPDATGSVGSFSLIEGDGSLSALMSTSLGISGDRASVKGFMSNGTELSASELREKGAEVSYESSNPEIATIDAKNGRILDIANGDVTISAKVKLGGAEFTSETAYSALISTGPGIEIFYDLHNAITAIGMTTTSLVSEGKDPPFAAIDYSKTGGLFRVFASSYEKHTNGRIQYSSTLSSVRSIILADTRYISFEVFIPRAGVYDLEVYHASNKLAIGVDVYFGKDKVTMDDSTYVGSYTCYNSEIEYTPNYFRVPDANPSVIKHLVADKPGYYILTFVGNDGKDGNNDYYYGNVGNFRLKSGSESVLASVIPGETTEDDKLVMIGVDNTIIEFSDPDNKPTLQVKTTVEKRNGEVLDIKPESITYQTSNRAVAAVSKNGVITPMGDGNADITVNAVIDGVPCNAVLHITVRDNTGIKTAEINVRDKIYVRDLIKPTLILTMNSGNKVFVPFEETEFSAEPSDVVEMSDGMIKVKAEGAATIKAKTNYRGLIVETEKEVSVVLDDGKTESTYYTDERRANALENVKKYSWAANMKKSAVTAADKYVDKFEQVYNLIEPDNLPRSMRPAGTNDPDYIYCRYCHADVNGKYGKWTTNPLTRPWKIQCPECKRYFPSNDFESFYKLGLDEYGNFSRERALEAHAELFGDKTAAPGSDAYYGYGVPGGYLTNILYPELENVDTLNCGQGLRPGEKVETWGVDDGWGYMPKDENGNNYLANKQNNIYECHCYIATYNYDLWVVIEDAVTSLSDAYLYTGDIKYGRAGAIILDRIADVHPTYDTRKYYSHKPKYWLADANTGYGKYRGRITDTMFAESFAFCCDAFYPLLFEDSEVIRFLSKKAETLKLENKKSTSAEIWENWETGILLQNFDDVKTGKVEGNFGLLQQAISGSALVLDKEPESKQMLDWLFEGDGKILKTIIEEVDYDGMGGETADGYNIEWINGLADTAKYLSFYNGDVDYNLFDHPKFGEMLVAYDRKMVTNSTTVNVGDSRKGTATIGFNGPHAMYDSMFRYMKDTPYAKRLAQFIYVRHKFDLNNLTYDVFEKNPENIKNEILALVDENPKQKSDLMAGYGISVLRDGGNYTTENSSIDKNSLRDFWMFFGDTDGHGHQDLLGIGMDAFGFDVSPDLGYPRITGTDPERLQWTQTTLAHNTVVVDGVKQSTDAPWGVPHHFDSTENVKLIEASATPYKQAENYRRTLVMVKAGDDISYGVDFFRVTGGNTHTFSFHGQAENAIPVDGLSMTEQKDESGNWVGSYAGADVPYGPDPNSPASWTYDTVYPRGYTWLSKVRRDKDPAEQFAVEFDIKDYRKLVKDSSGIRLRMTQLNDFKPDEVAICAGLLPDTTGNKVMPRTFDYVIVQHEGENLDSLFTTVYEPYKNNRYIEKIEAVDITTEESVSEKDKARAVKVTRTDGKCDYIVYSSDNSVKYTVKDNTGEAPFEFDFRGFVGVLSLSAEGDVIYRYVNDGDIIGVPTETPAKYTGIVANFDKTYGFGDYENWIDIKPDGEIDTEALAGEHIYIKNDGAKTAVYKIESASENGDGTIRLDIGTITLVRAYADPENFDRGYVYNIEEDEDFVIPLSYEDASLPIFEENDNITATAGGTVNIKVTATSPIEGKTVTYRAEMLPRGASLNEMTGEITWKPDSSQVGDNNFAITAIDSDGREATQHFTVTVYGATTGGGGGGAGGGAGGGGGGTTPSNPDDGKKDEEESGDNKGDNTGDNEGENTGDNEGDNTGDKWFIDVPTDSWFYEPIKYVFDNGIMNGMSEEIFAPNTRVNRGMFVTVLYRMAGEPDVELTDKFTDIAPNAYYAKAVAWASEKGVVKGISETEYAPNNDITREQMAAMLYRNAEANGEDVSFGEVKKFADTEKVSEYAKDAVSYCIAKGLIAGKTETEIKPQDFATRAEVATILMRMLQK